jgi:two-component system sensor histidine kinase UhpB
MKHSLRLLLIEDSDDDALLLLRHIKKGGYEVVHERVDSDEGLKAALQDHPWDIVISDYAMPAFSGLDALRIVQEHGLDVPFLLVSGQIGEDMAVAAMKAGAHDYLMKGKLARLLPAVERELREADVRRARKRADLALRESEERFRQLGENIGAVFFMSENPSDDSPGHVSYVSPAYERIWGRSRQEIYQNPRDWLEAVHPADLARILEAVPKMVRGEFNEDFRIVRPDNKTRWIHLRVFPVRNEAGTVYRVAGLAEDITEREESAQKLRETVEALQKTEEELRARNMELSEAREKLEIRVRERTADLSRTNAELKRQINERKRLENELIEATETERKRIGIDLHDDLGQHLNGIALMLKGLELKLQGKSLPEATDAARIQSLVFKTINHAHNMAKGLASMDWQGDDDLAQGLTSLAAHVKNLFGITCNFNVSGEATSLPMTVVSQLYKIAQEAVTNAVKHGQAKQVEIGLAFDPEKMVLTIKNDGLPFPEKERASGRMGLHIMAHRASVIDASLSVKASGRRGTIVTCTLPNKEPRPAGFSQEPESRLNGSRPALVQA